MFPECLRVSVVDDEALEGAEAFLVVLAAERGFEEVVNLTRPSATVTILDNEGIVQFCKMWFQYYFFTKFGWVRFHCS